MLNSKNDAVLQPSRTAARCAIKALRLLAQRSRATLTGCPIIGNPVPTCPDRVERHWTNRAGESQSVVFRNDHPTELGLQLYANRILLPISRLTSVHEASVKKNEPRQIMIWQ
jgi:hypothetical protein